MNLDCLDELVGLATIQKNRVFQFWEKERESNVPLSSLTGAMNDYRRLLHSIQKLKFDLGLDEFKGVTRGVRATAPSVTRDDDTELQRQVFDAVTNVEEIFRKRGIRDIPDVDLPDV